MVTAVLLLAIMVTPALLCLPQFPSDQVVPIPCTCSCYPGWHCLMTTCALLGQRKFQNVSVANTTAAVDRQKYVQNVSSKLPTQ